MPRMNTLSPEVPMELSQFGTFLKKKAKMSKECVCSIFCVILVGRQFSGHQDRVTTVEYHPSKGYYIVSGAADSIVKVWDVRRKSCLHSFKGNSKSVTQSSFSPDGKWICTGYADGEVKLWDIRTRKLLHTFRQHKGRISGIEFHPTECLMATASYDGSVRLWDLETAETVEKIGPERNEVRCIQFSKEGDFLLTALPDGLKSHGWEPYTLHDAVSIPWTHVVDMAIWQYHKKLVVCTCDQTRVGVWLVDLKKLRPFSMKDVPKEEGSKSSRKGESVPALKFDSIMEMRDSDSSARTSTSGRYSEKYSAFSTERSGKALSFSIDPDSDRVKSKSLAERSLSVRSNSKELDSERVRFKTLTERSSTVKPLPRTPQKLDLSEVQRPFCPPNLEPSPKPQCPLPPSHDRQAAFVIRLSETVFLQSVDDESWIWR